MIDSQDLIKAMAFVEKGLFDEAEKVYLELLEIEPENFAVLSSYGFLEFKCKNYEKSAEILEKAFMIKPEEGVVQHLVKALTSCGKLLEAEKYCVNYLKEHQKSSALWFQLGFLKELIYSDDNQACECYKIALKYGAKTAYYNIAVSYQKLGKHLEAEENYKKMLEYFPDDNETLTSLGMCKLSQRKFREGYELFIKRENNKIANLWQGGNLDHTLNIFCDQGFGDHIQFVRYLPFLKEKGYNFKVAVHPSLRELFEKNYPAIEFISYEEINPQIQTLRITDLAYALNMDFDNIPFSEGYLKSETADISSDKLKVGLCWEAGSAGIRTMINRTINIRLLEPFLNLENVQIYSFQVRDSLNGNERYPQMINLAKDFKSFEDTARALKAMDLMISVDTSVAHLAGALGVKTFLMIPYAADWRWFSDTKTTPWYNSIEVFKQNDPISWEKPIGEIVCRLKEYSL